MLMANQRLSVDFGFNYWNVYTQSLICFAYSTSSANPAPPPDHGDGVHVSSWRAAASTGYGVPDRGLAFAAGGAFNLQQQRLFRACGGDLETNKARHGQRGLWRQLCSRQHYFPESADAFRHA